MSRRQSQAGQQLRRLQRGLSLVELMVAMMIGLFLMAGVLSVYGSSKQSYRYQSGLAEVQEQGRFAMNLLTSSLRMAGFPGDNPPPGNKIEGTDGAPDTVTVSLRENLDCLDNATGGVAVNRYRISAGDLQCSGDGITWDTYVRNVEDLQLVYGEDTNADGVPNRYVTATDGPNWANVVAVRVSLLVRSSDFAAPAAESFIDLTGATVTSVDQRIRRSFESTITLRN